MHTIPPNFKRLLFNKEADDPLTPEEQTTWDEYVARAWPQHVTIDLDDPVFRKAMKLHFLLEEENTASWNKFENEVLQQYETINTPAVQFVKQPKTGLARIPAWVWAAAAILIIAGATWFFDRSSGPDFRIASTGYGEIDTLTLPDGSQVCLNNVSSLTYPAVFTGDERHVELNGEAHFIVVRNPADPFRITTPSQVDVIAKGTEFNVKAYKEDSMVAATLKHGVLSIRHDGIDTQILPGYRAIVKGDHYYVNKFQFDSVVAWQQKYILLEGESLESVLQQIHRYYNVPVGIDGTPPPIHLSGQVRTVHNLDEMIELLNKVTDKTRFRIDKETGKVIASEGTK